MVKAIAAKLGQGWTEKRAEDPLPPTPADSDPAAAAGKAFVRGVLEEVKSLFNPNE